MQKQTLYNMNKIQIQSSITNTIIFTRYLYEKSEVELSLITCLLKKKVEESLFWAYELHYSGFTQDLITLIWKIYYDFYATLNPKFEAYLLQKLKSGKFEDKIVYMIINDFLIRPFNLDVFILRQIVTNFEITSTQVNTPSLIEYIDSLLESKNFISLAHFIIHDVKDDIALRSTYKTIIEYFKHCGLKLNDDNIMRDYEKVKMKNDPNIILVSRIMHYYSLLKKLKMGKSLYIIVEPEELVIYETIEADLKVKEGKYNPIFPAHKILPIASIYEIDSENLLNLFNLNRYQVEYDTFITNYYHNWLYCASFSPIWYKRIEKFNGTINHTKKHVEFNNDEDEENFYKIYGYEPDEQKSEVQMKSIKPILHENTWETFYKAYKNNCLLDIEDEYLLQMPLVTY